MPKVKKKYCQWKKSMKYQQQRMKNQTLRQNQKMKKVQWKKTNFEKEKQGQHPG